MDITPTISEEAISPGGEHAHEFLIERIDFQLTSIEESLIEEGRQRGEVVTREDVFSRLVENIVYRRLLFHKMLLLRWGKQIREWPNKTVQEPKENKSVPALSDISFLIHFPFSDQKAMIRTMISGLLSRWTWELFWKFGLLLARGGEGLSAARDALGHDYRGLRWSWRLAAAAIYVLYAILMPVFFLIVTVVLFWVRGYVEKGFRLPALAVLDRFSDLGLPLTAPPPGENGYTKVFQGGDVVDLGELEKELTERNEASSQYQNEADVVIVGISYKHYANKGKVPGDDHRICRPDLQAIAYFIRTAGHCKIRFWIDHKLPRTTDDRFERWLDRGVRPYIRYITFICPSAQRYANYSFWLSNEYHLAIAARGIFYFKGNKIYFGRRVGDFAHLSRRFLRVMIQAERQPVQVRDQDKGKVVNWAMRCLSRGPDESMVTRNIDYVAMVRENRYRLLFEIGEVIKKFGDQELPMGPGKSWNKSNPLLLDDIPDVAGQEFDLSTWYGFSHDEAPETVYFIDSLEELDRFETVLVLEVTLERSHSTPGTIRVLRKVLRQVSSSEITRCKLVALPWLCDWE